MLQNLGNGFLVASRDLWRDLSNNFTGTESMSQISELVQRAINSERLDSYQAWLNRWAPPKQSSQTDKASRGTGGLMRFLGFFTAQARAGVSTNVQDGDNQSSTTSGLELLQ